MLDKIKTAWNAYNYKFITAFVLAIVIGLINNSVGSSILKWIDIALFSGVGLYIIAAFFRGVYNLWNDEQKGMAIFFLVGGLAFVALLCYLFIVVAPNA